MRIRAFRSHPISGLRRSVSAFTLIEIMIVVGIMAIIMAIALPSFYKEAHKDSIRKAVADISEACSTARARAVLNGVATEVRIRPREHRISVVESSSRATSTVGSAFRIEGEQIVENGGGGSIFSATISDHIVIEFIGVNLVPDLQDLDEVTCVFYPNGTSDELAVLLRSDQGEVRKVTTEVVTGLADVEVVK